MNKLFLSFFLAAAVLTIAQEPPPLNPRFGINTHTDGKLAAEAGAGWIRFENLKWGMVSAKPGEYVWNGSLQPWFPNFDRIFETAARQRVNVLAYAFEAADYSLGASASSPNARHYPPKDFDAYAEFVFQAAARYGQTQHDAAELKSVDKRSGLGSLRALEIWNEPNLHDPGWGSWVGSLDRYFELFKKAAGAAKKADPKLLILHGGFAGVETRPFEKMKAAGALEFTDALNVHFYCHPAPPEADAVDPNVNRDPKGKTKHSTLERDLQRLVAWRDENAPQKPIWMTEFGWDTVSGEGRVSESLQADYLVRAAVLMWANGVDKVFWFRESDSAKPAIQFDSCGLVDGKGRKKPSFTALQNLARELGETFTFEKRLAETTTDVRVYQFKTGRGRLMIAWSTGDPQTVNLAGKKYALTGTPIFLRE